MPLVELLCSEMSAAFRAAGARPARSPLTCQPAPHVFGASPSLRVHCLQAVELMHVAPMLRQLPTDGYAR